MSRITYYNGNFITLEKDMPRAEYLISEEGIITEMGRGMPPLRSAEDKIVDLKGKTVVPGFTDSHLHMLTGALTKLQIDLNGMRFENVSKMAEYVKNNAPGGNGWIRAFGFSEENLAEPKLPTMKELDEAILDRPVIITRVCGHLSIINSAAMKLLSPEAVETIEGGEFQKDSLGCYTGVVTETAQQYVLDSIPAPSEEEIFVKLREEQKSLLSKGICSIHDAGTDQLSPEEYKKIYKKFNDNGDLKLRTYLMLRPDDGGDFAEFAEDVKQLKKEYPPEKSRLFFGAVKLFADGSLGGKTAAVRKGYEGEADNKGLLLDDRLRRYLPEINKAGLKIAVHAIGDRAVEYCLNLIEEGRENEAAHVKHRIEHAELLGEDLIKRIKENDVFIAAQPGFIPEFGATYRKVIGEEAEKIQPLKTMLKEGIELGFGTDYPVIDANPLMGIAAAVERNVKNGEKPLCKREALEAEEALKAYTMGSAAGSDTEHLQGSLKVGKFADFAVLEKEIYPASEVLATVIGGELLYLQKGDLK